MSELDKDAEEIIDAGSEPGTNREAEEVEAIEADEALPGVDEQEAEREKLKAERDQKHDLHLRARADLDNFRKRVARDRPLIAAQAKRDLVAALLPAIDALDLALGHAAEAAEVGALLEGVKAARDSMESALASQGVERISAEGAYNPELHQAGAVVESADQPDGTIIEELRAGYRIGDLVARHAVVVVSKAPSTEAEVEESEELEAEEAP
jgi:molecular chaperone GrpE